MRRIRNSSPFFLSSCLTFSRTSLLRLSYSVGKVLLDPSGSIFLDGWPPTTRSQSYPPLLPGLRSSTTNPPPTHKAAWLLARPLPRDFAILKLLSYRVLRSSFLLHSLIKAQPGGDEGTRTPDIRLAKAALSHLSYIPRHTLRGSGPDWIRTSDPCVISTVL
jgi:hypothetical protein